MHSFYFAGPCAVHSFSLPARVGYMRSGSIFPAEARRNSNQIKAAHDGPSHQQVRRAATIVDRL